MPNKTKYVPVKPRPNQCTSASKTLRNSKSVRAKTVSGRVLARCRYGK